MMKKISAFLLVLLSATTLPLWAAGKKQAALKPYPLDVCLVSDEKLGEMDDPYVFAYKGQEIKLCCKPCAKDFKKDPAKYLKKLETAAKTGPKSGKK
ncbi:MAG TPA: hypothetical protein PKN95_03660 [Verrucomicrobiota bacterium]|nr:hypothetical protein [Verrucomicrobiota bacterium]